jgi:hypothetical protein
MFGITRLYGIVKQMIALAAGQASRRCVRARRTTVLPRLEELESRLVLSTFLFTPNDSPGNFVVDVQGTKEYLWSKAPNWKKVENDNNHVVPGAGDTVIIGVGDRDVLRVDQTTQVGTVELANLTNAVLQLSGTLQIQHLFSVRGGSVTGAGAIDLLSGSKGTWSGGAFEGGTLDRQGDPKGVTDILAETGSTFSITPGGQSSTLSALRTVFDSLGGVINVNPGNLDLSLSRILVEGDGAVPGTLNLATGVHIRDTTPPGAANIKPSSIDNSGIVNIVRANGANTVHIDVPYNNSGSTNINSSEGPSSGQMNVSPLWLVLQGGGKNSGQFNIAQYGYLFLQGGSYNWSSPDPLGVVLNPRLVGTVILNANLQMRGAMIPKLTMEGGTLALAGQLTIGWSLDVYGGTIKGGTLVIPPPEKETEYPWLTPPGATFGTPAAIQHFQTTPPVILLIDTTLINNGQLNLQPVTLQLSKASVTNAGVISILGDSSTSIEEKGDFEPEDQIVNNGKIIKPSGQGTTVIYIPVQNNGTIIQQSGTLDLRNLIGNPMSKVQIDPATVQVDDGLSLPAGSSLSGSGYVVGDVSNGGEIDPGETSSAGFLNFSNDYTQTPASGSGTLNIGIGGTSPGTSFDQVNVAGRAVLGGTLNINNLPGFTPSLGQSFEIMTFASSTGTFQSVNGLSLGNGLAFDIEYNPTNVTLKVVSASTASAPTVSGLSPNTGSTGGGTSVGITGTNFDDVTGVFFGTTPAASYTVNSSTSISATAPSSAATGTVDVTVATETGTSSTSSADQFTYTAAPAPTVTGVSPSLGGAQGGDTVTITGSNLAGATAVDFGSVAAPYFLVDSPTEITALSPAGSPGTVDVTVSTAGGTSTTSSADKFTYPGAPAVTGVSPGSGSSGGGSSVTITGSGFTDASAVSFGSVDTTDFTVNSDTSITAVVPAQAAGSVDVTVTTASGTSALTSADRYTYTAAPAPVLSSLGTTTGSTAGGTQVIVTGSGFTGASEVLFGGVPSDNFVVNSDSQITAFSPSQDAGIVYVQVVTPSGTSAASSSDQFTYTNATAPSVTGLSTSSGTTAGGTVVTVTGSGFTGATEVNFGSVEAESFQVLDDTTLVATAPAQAAGTCDLTVTTPSGTSATGSADKFTYTAAAAPSVTGVSPNSGTTPGGNAVTITGSGFTGATAVNFGSVAASDFTVNSDGSLTAYAPPEAAATVDITVTTPSGTSTTSSADHYTYRGFAATKGGIDKGVPLAEDGLR